MRTILKARLPRSQRFCRRPQPRNHHEDLKANPQPDTWHCSLDRGESRRLELAPDDEWKTRMRRGDHRLVTALTWPLLLRYRYLAWRG